eukprot:SAG31_NODE_30218_length_384_cov_0.694737_1_plen_57_part_10
MRQAQLEQARESLLEKQLQKVEKIVEARGLAAVGSQHLALPQTGIVDGVTTGGLLLA